MKRLRQIFSKVERIFVLTGATFSVAVLISAYSGGAAFAAGQTQNSRMTLFNSAAQEFNVPVSVLVALSYNETHMQSSTGASIDNGYGLMNLRTNAATTISGRDGSTVPVKASAQQQDSATLDQAAQLLHESADTLKTNDQENIRGATADLAQDAKQLNGGKLPTDPNDWYSAVAQFSDSSDGTTASSFADDVFSTVKSGLNLTTTDGQVINIPATPNVQPNKNSMSALGLQNAPASVTPPTGAKAECPSTLNCRFIPAAYAQDNPSDPTNYGNYDPANRPQDMQIKYIYIHDTEGSYDGTISHFQDPTAYDSAQYVVRSSDGAVTQMVRNEDVSWGVRNWYDNTHGINIENEGFAATGATYYTPAMYQADATLVRYLAAKYHMPLDREHILGHDNIPAAVATSMPTQHSDPGPFWNWNYFMKLIQGQSTAQTTTEETAMTLSNEEIKIKKGDVVTINPHFVTNQLPVTDCLTGTCTQLPAQGTSFVYLRTQPNSRAPLLSDPYLHADKSAGTTEDSDWGDKAPAGMQYVVADTQSDWTAIWFAGQEAWFYNPSGPNRTATESTSHTVIPKAGMNSIAVYSTAYPEASAYPASIPVQPLNQIYAIPAGQAYTTTAQDLPTDYYYDATINYSRPDDHAIVHGNTKFYQVTINHRIGYVKASDVTVE